MAENMRFTAPSLEVKYGKKGDYVMAAGSIALDGSGATVVDCVAIHGITTIKGAVTTTYIGTAPGDDLSICTVTWSAGNLSIWPWEYASGTDATLVASDAQTVISYMVWGIV